MLFSSMIWLALPMISLGSMGASDIAAEQRLYEKDDWHPPPPPRDRFIDFDELVSDFIKNETDSRNQIVTWWDLYARHPFVKKRPEFSKYRIRVEVGEINYGNLNSTHATRRWRKEPIKNSNNTNKEEIITGELKHHTTYSWQVTNGIMLDREKTSLKIMFTGLGDVTDLVTIDLSTDREVRSRRKDVFQYSIRIKPGKSVNLYWNVSTWDTELDFSLDVKIDGYYGIYYSAPQNGHKIWYYPICTIQHEKFSVSGNSLIYKATGIFRDTRDISASVIESANRQQKKGG